jgi:hypothetical protein
MNNIKTLCLAWHDKARTHLWFPVGRLDAEPNKPEYRFRYTYGSQEAERLAGFKPLPEFPHFKQDYRSPQLFQTFQNRVMQPGRPDFPEYLKQLDLPETAGPLEILAVDGGHRITDNFEVFPKAPMLCHRFFLQDWNLANSDAQEHIHSLKAGENLHLALEITMLKPDHPFTTKALQIQTEEHHTIGWAPNYLATELQEELSALENVKASVVRINPQPAPARQRVLIELQKKWGNYPPIPHFADPL